LFVDGRNLTSPKALMPLANMRPDSL